MTQGFGDFFPAIAGAIGGIFNQEANSQGIFLSAQQQKKLMEHQAKLNYKYYKKDLLNRWALARQGLVAGDYNPLLAVQQGINGNSSWTNQASVSDANAGSSFASGVSNATGMQQLIQQGELNDSTIDLNNSQALLNEEKANTEQYTQFEKANHADLMEAERVLADKNASYIEKKQAWEQKESAKRIEQMGSQIKLNNQHSMLIRSQDLLTRTQQESNAEDVRRKQIENQKIDTYYNDPKYKRLRQKQWEFGRMLNDITGGSKLPNIQYSPKTFNRY